MTFRQGSKDNIVATNEWANTIHTHVKLKIAILYKINIKTSSTNKELADYPKRIQIKTKAATPRACLNVCSLKETWKSHKMNRIDKGSAKILTTGVETCSKVIQE